MRRGIHTGTDGSVACMDNKGAALALKSFLREVCYFAHYACMHAKSRLKHPFFREVNQRKVAMRSLQPIMVAVLLLQVRALRLQRRGKHLEKKKRKKIMMKFGYGKKDLKTDTMNLSLVLVQKILNFVRKLHDNMLMVFVGCYDIIIR